MDRSLMIEESRLKEKRLKLCKHVRCFHFRLCMSVCCACGCATDRQHRRHISSMLLFHFDLKVIVLVVMVDY